MLPQPAGSTHPASRAHPAHGTSIALISGCLPGHCLGSRMGASSRDRAPQPMSQFVPQFPHLSSLWPSNRQGCGHHATVSVGLVTCSELGTGATTSDTPAACSQEAPVLLGPEGDNPEPRGPVARRGAQSPAGAERRRSTGLVLPVPNQWVSATSQGLLRIGRLEGVNRSLPRLGANGFQGIPSSRAMDQTTGFPHLDP